MTTKDEALQMALEALEYSDNCLAEIAAAHGVSSKKAKEGGPAWRVRQAIAACREALAQKDEPEPFVWMWNLRSDPIHKGYYEKHPASYGIDVSSQKYIWTPLYTASPKRKPLTDEKLRAMWVNYAPIVGGVLEFARAIEAAHGIGAEHDA